MSDRQFRVGDFVLDVGAESLSRDGVIIHLKPQVFAVLAYLASHAGELVTRNALIDHVWGRREVDFDANLNTIMLQIRRALGDTAETPRYIETVPRKGYRVVATVSRLSPSNRRVRWHRTYRTLVAAALLIVAFVSIGSVSPVAAPQQELSADIQILYARGKKALQGGDFPLAVDLLEQTLAASPEFAPAYACLALAHMGMSGGSDDGVERSRELLDRALTISPRDPTSLTVAAQVALAHEGKPDKARLLLDQALKHEKAGSHTYLLSAWHYSASGDHDKAREAINQALLLDPLSPRINETAAQIYEASGDGDSARRFSILARDLTAET